MPTLKYEVDRIACPWLIRKFIDRYVQFVFRPHDPEWAKELPWEIKTCR